jgi:hypothetical protein
VLNDAVCEICNEENETPEHIISGSTFGKKFWETLNKQSIMGIDTTNLHMVTAPGGVPNEELPAFIALSC